MSGKREIADAMLNLPPSSPEWGYDEASKVHYLVDGWRIANVVAAGDKWQLNVTWGAMDTARTADTLAEAKTFCERFGPARGKVFVPGAGFEEADLVDVDVDVDALGPGEDDPGVQ